MKKEKIIFKISIILYFPLCFSSNESPYSRNQLTQRIAPIVSLSDLSAAILSIPEVGSFEAQEKPAQGTDDYQQFYIQPTASLENIAGRGIKRALPTDTPHESQSKRRRIFNIEEELNNAFLKSIKEENNDQMVSYLNQNANVNARDAQGLSGLHHAALLNNTKISKILYARDADINARDNTGNTPLHLAAGKAHSKASTFLLSKGADINARNNIGSTPLHHLAASDKTYHGRQINFLLSRGADINAYDNAGNTPLHVGASQGNKKSINSLLRQGADINARTKDFLTPLDIAIRNGRTKAAKILAKKALQLLGIEKFNQSKYALALFDHFIDKSNTPLHRAVLSNDQAGTEILIDQGFSVNARNNVGFTPLHYAALYNYTDLAQFLISKGAIIFANSFSFGPTPLDIAIQNNNEELISIMTNKLLERSSPEDALPYVSDIQNIEDIQDNEDDLLSLFDMKVDLESQMDINLDSLFENN